jgi:hypothetical protein
MGFRDDAGLMVSGDFHALLLMNAWPYSSRAVMKTSSLSKLYRMLSALAGFFLLEPRRKKLAE